MIIVYKLDLRKELKSLYVKKIGDRILKQYNCMCLNQNKT